MANGTNATARPTIIFAATFWLARLSLRATARGVVDPKREETEAYFPPGEPHRRR